MEDTSFLYFTQDIVIDRLDIDPRLVDSFKRVMVMLQEYFNVNGYTKDRNYKEFMQKYLLNSNNPFKFYVNKLANDNVGGFYSKVKNAVCINETYLDYSTEEIDSTLCHEFIHFLVMHGLTDEFVQNETEVKNGGFINEALTEMLTKQMYPSSNAYDAQVSLMEYANLLGDKVNNYSRFLNGFVDARYSGHRWNDFIDFSRKFQNDFKQEGYINLINAKNNQNFINAQRSLLKCFLFKDSKISFEQYLISIEKLSKRVVSDDEYVNEKIIPSLDKQLLENLNLRNENIQQFLLDKLKEVRKLVIEKNKYDGKKVFEFEFCGRKLAIDENNNMYGNILGISREYSPKNGKVILTFNGDRKEFNINELDFNLRDREIQSKIKTLSTYFSIDLKDNLFMINKAISQEGELKKLEKFTLPMVGVTGRKTPITVYIATYDDKIVLLNDSIEMGILDNVQLAHYIGMTSADPSKGAIYSDNLGTIDKGIVYSNLKSYQIKNNAISMLAKRLESSMSDEQIRVIIDKYKQSDDFYGQVGIRLKDDALSQVAEVEFYKMDFVDQEKLMNEVKGQSQKFIVSLKDKELNVGLLFWDKILTAFQGEKEVLVDRDGKGLYNIFYDELSKMVGNENKKNNGTIINADIFNTFEHSKEQSKNESKNTVDTSRILFIKKLRNKYGYDMMNEQERLEFMDKIEEILMDYDFERRISDISIEQFFYERIRQMQIEEMERQQIENNGRRII